MKEKDSVIVSSLKKQEQELRRNVQKSPQNPEAYYRLGGFLNENGNLAEAADALRQASTP